MILDERVEFIDAGNAFGADAVTEVKGDVVDTQIGALNTVSGGYGESPVYWVLEVTTAFSGGSNVKFELRTADNEALETNAVIHIDNGDETIANLAVGYRRVYKLPPTQTYRKYMGVYGTHTGTSTAGAINSYLVFDAERWDPYVQNIPTV